MKRPTNLSPEQPYSPFNRPPPGWSLTQPKGKWPWDSPPQYTKPDEVVDMIIDKLENPQLLERYMKLMIAGVSVEEIVQSISIAGFAEGKFTPDIAEIIKPPIAMYLVAKAKENEIPVRIFAAAEKEREDEAGLPMGTILRIMERRNPDMYNFIRTRELEQMREMRSSQAKRQGTLLEADMPVETGAMGFVDQQEMPEPLPEEMGDVEEPMEGEEE